jgi:SNF2 family DNA or RNA helicase
VKRFQEDPACPLFLISLKAGGQGLNLTAADYVFILDPWWNPTTEQQAIARAHRIGQDKNVIAIKFITKDSIEEKILKLQDKKSKLAEDIIENVNRAEFSRGDIEFLLE